MSTSTFDQWLKKQRRRDDPVGDLARDRLQDYAWPRVPGTRLRGYRSYLAECGACNGAERALERAYQEWLKQREQGAEGLEGEEE